MEITWITFLIVCPLVFLAGLVDAIGGGGGLISLPAYLLAGIPTHMAIATNKLSSACGTTLATARFIKNKMVNLKLSIVSIIAAMIGSSIGAYLSMLTNEQVMKYILMAILPITAVVVLNKRWFRENSGAPLLLNKKTYATVILCALFIGMYDGFYGPGTGTFLIIAFTLFAKMDIKNANGQAKVINLTTNVSSLVVFLLHGQVLVLLGLAAAICNMLGGYIGAGLVLKGGMKIVKPSIILVLVLLFLKIIGIY